MATETETKPAAPASTPSPDQVEQYRDALLKHFMSTINSPQPQPPQYQPPQLSPRQGFALAQNPQAATRMMQYANAPAQAQYAQQQAAFEAAMDERKTAMTLGSSLINAQTRATGKGLHFIKSTVKGPDGTNRVKVDVFDPNTFQYIGSGDLGEAGSQPFIGPGINPETGAAELTSVDKGTGRGTPVTNARGQTYGAVPPEGAVKAAEQTLNFGQQLKAAEDSFASYITKKSTGQRMGTSALLQLPFGLKGPADEFIVSYTDPEGSITSRNLKSVADSLLRLKSGAQINEEEYNRLSMFLPKLGENPMVAQKKFQQFRSELSETLKRRMQLQPGLFSDEALKASGFMRSDLMSLIASGPTEVTIPTSVPEASAANVIHMSDVRAKYPNPADQQRIIQKAKAAGISVVED